MGTESIKKENNPSEKTIEQKKEIKLQHFFNRNYDFCLKAFESSDIERQISAAYLLLDIKNPKEDFLDKSTEEAINFLASRYRAVSKDYHPDRFSGCSEETKEKAQKLFKLLAQSHDILKNIQSENETKIFSEIKKTSLQKEYIPSYPYELKEGFQQRPHYYVAMALTSEPVDLVRSGSFFEEENTADSSVPSTALTEKNKSQIEFIRMPGYKAFYYLFIADALPRKFSMQEMVFIFGLNGDNLAKVNPWLVEKVLTTREFIEFMDGRFLFVLAQAATARGIITVGSNNSDIFKFYCQNYPSFICSHNIAYLFEESRDASEVESFLLQNPELLMKLNMNALARLVEKSEKLKNYILQDKALTKHLSNYYLEAVVLDKYFKGSKLADIEKMALRELLQGNTKLISSLSIEVIGKISKELNEDANSLPVWFKTEVQALSQTPDALRKENNIKTRSKNQIDVDSYLKEQFEISPETLSYLNKETLISLATRIHPVRHLPIVEALFRLNQSEKALPLLNELADILKIEKRNKLGEALLLEVQENRQALEKAKENKINLYLEMYDSVLKEQKEGDLTEITEKLIQLGAEESLNDYKIKQQDDLREKLGALQKKFIHLKETSSFPDYQVAFSALKSKVESMGLNWRKFFGEPSVFKLHTQNVALRSILFDIMHHYIGIKSDKYAIIEDFIKPEYFGFLKREKGLLGTLKELHQAYECVGMSDVFYENLFLLYGESEKKDSKNDFDMTGFDSLNIQKLLLSYLRNEFFVFVEGERKDNGYKGFFHSVKGVDEIYSVFDRLDKKDFFEELLPTTYKKFLELEKEYAIRDDLRTNYPDHSERPLMKYLKIRLYSEKTDPILEDLALQYELHRVISAQYGNLEKKNFIYSSNNKAVDLCRFIKENFKYAAIKPLIGKGDPKQIQEKTKLMLSEVNAYLKEHKNVAQYNDLLSQFKKSHILSYHLTRGSLVLPDVHSKKTEQKDVKSIKNKADTLSSSTSTFQETTTDAVQKKSISGDGAAPDKQSDEEKNLSEEKRRILKELATYEEKRQKSGEYYNPVLHFVLKMTKINKISKIAEKRSKTAKIDAVRQLRDQIKSGTFKKENMPEAAKNGELKKIMSTFKP